MPRKTSPWCLCYRLRRRWKFAEIICQVVDLVEGILSALLFISAVRTTRLNEYSLIIRRQIKNSRRVNATRNPIKQQKAGSSKGWLVKVVSHNYILLSILTDMLYRNILFASKIPGWAEDGFRTTSLGFGIVSMFVSPYIGKTLNLSDYQFDAWVGTGIQNSWQVVATCLACTPNLAPGTAVAKARSGTLSGVSAHPPWF